MIALSSALLLVSIAFAQQAAESAAGAATPQVAQDALQVAEPHYVTISKAIEVDAPADKVWARVGNFCDIGKWDTASESACKYLAGDGDVGSVRSVDNEVMVGKTNYSYTYTKGPRKNTIYDLYHGTLEVIPVSPTTSRLNYVLFFDTTMLGDDTTREKYMKERRATIDERLRNMKTLAESSEGSVSPVHHQTGSGEPVKPGYLSENPHYVVIPMQMEVNAPADTVWSHIGHFCDIGKIGAIGYPTCRITSGVDGEYGVVRNIGREVLVGKTKYSYTYAQQMHTTGFYLLYHGTIEARPVTAKTSTLCWTLVYDNSNLPDETARETDIASRRTHFLAMMQNVKTISEGGVLPQ